MLKEMGQEVCLMFERLRPFLWRLVRIGIYTVADHVQG
jgi:hypothetical protein